MSALGQHCLPKLTELNRANRHLTLGSELSALGQNFLQKVLGQNYIARYKWFKQSKLSSDTRF